MKLAIIGAGNVGGALGAAWAQKAGHEIFFGVRDQKADKTQALLRAIGAKARAGTAAEAAAFADIIVLSTPWPAAEAAIRSMGNIKGKIILDATNPLTRGAGRHRPGDRPQHLRRREGARLGGWRFGVQDAQHHRLRQYGESGFQRREVGDVRRRRRRDQQAEGDRSGRPARLRRGGRRAAAQCAPLEAHAMLWIDLALARGQGRDFAFAIVRR